MVETPNEKLGIWKIIEPIAFFEKTPRSYKNGFNESFPEWRKKEFLAARFLLWQLLKEQEPYLIRNENDCLILPGRKEKISISHTREMAAAIISHQNIVGIDIEMIRPKVHRIAHKFLNVHEVDLLGKNPQTEQLILFWSAKETIFKMLQIPGLSFKENIILSLPIEKENGELTAKVSGLKNALKIQFEFIENHVLTFSSAPVVP